MKLCGAEQEKGQYESPNAKTSLHIVSGYRPCECCHQTQRKTNDSTSKRSNPVDALDKIDTPAGREAFDGARLEPAFPSDGDPLDENRKHRSVVWVFEEVH